LPTISSRGGTEVANDDAQKAWDRFESDVKGLAGELKRHYKEASDEKRRADLNRSLEQLRQAADAVFNSLETATRDPEVRSRTKQAARSFGSAIAETFRDLGDEVDKVVRKAGGDHRKS
jgi:hypothetical protein